MRSKDSRPVWGEGAGKVPYWQLADALLYRTPGLGRGGWKSAGNGNSLAAYSTSWPASLPSGWCATLNGPATF